MAEEEITVSPKETGADAPETVVTGSPSEQMIAPEQGTVPEIRAEKSEGAYHELLSKVAGPSQGTTDDTAVALDTKSISETVDEESKIQKLLELATTKGVVHAVRVARSLKDYYALDRLHDELAGKLYQGLIEKGLIMKE